MQPIKIDDLFTAEREVIEAEGERSECLFVSIAGFGEVAIQVAKDDIAVFVTGEGRSQPAAGLLVTSEELKQEDS